MQSICQDGKDKIDEGIAIVLRANTHREKKGEKRNKHKQVKK